jgi:hypothetical protein
VKKTITELDRWPHAHGVQRYPDMSITIEGPDPVPPTSTVITIKMGIDYAKRLKRVLDDENRKHTTGAYDVSILNELLRIAIP